MLQLHHYEQQQKQIHLASQLLAGSSSSSTAFRDAQARRTQPRARARSTVSENGACSTLAGLLRLQKLSASIPNVLGKGESGPAMSGPWQLEPAAMQQLFEGRGAAPAGAEPGAPRTAT